MKVLSVYDGDTCTVAGWIPGGARKFKVRLNGIDTPEMRGGTKKEKDAAVKARDALSGRILGKIVTLEDVGTDKYGRVLATVKCGGEDICQWMIDEGHAKPYFGGTKEKFAPDRA